jgi:hypothetical protein
MYVKNIYIYIFIYLLICLLLEAAKIERELQKKMVNKHVDILINDNRILVLILIYCRPPR